MGLLDGEYKDNFVDDVLMPETTTIVTTKFSGDKRLASRVMGAEIAE